MILKGSINKFDNKEGIKLDNEENTQNDFDGKEEAFQKEIKKVFFKKN